jgi:hypothetical protein
MSMTEPFTPFHVLSQHSECPRSGCERLSELDEQAQQLEDRMAELRDELAVIERETVSPDAVQRAIALFEPIWDMLLPRERSRILHLLLESAIYQGRAGAPVLSPGHLALGGRGGHGRTVK